LKGGDGKVTAIVSVVLDMTELKNAQAGLLQSAKLASVGEMATGVAHELNPTVEHYFNAC